MYSEGRKLYYYIGKYYRRNVSSADRGFRTAEKLAGVRVLISDCRGS